MSDSSPLPLVSCLMVTAAGRLPLFERSVRAFARQTHARRQLVVVNEGPVEYQRDLGRALDGLSGEAGADVKTLFLDGVGVYTLAALRNLSAGVADGDLWVQWDDDDFCTPSRIARQAAFLLEHRRADASYLGDQLQYFFDSGELFWSDWSGRGHGGFQKHRAIPGTGMFRAGRLPWYPSAGPAASAGEDTHVFESTIARGRDAVAVLCGAGDMHCYSYHGNQVFGRDHHLAIARRRGRPIVELEARRRQIEKSLDEFRFGRTVSVCGSDGVAFEYASPSP